MNFNQVIVIGRITQNLELKKLPTGNSVLSFSVATNDNYKDKNGQKVEQVDFHNVTAFGKTAETITQYFVKGQEILVQGKLKTQSWDDKETGKKMYKTYIQLLNFEFGQKPKGTENQQQQQPDYSQYEDVKPEEIPF